MPTGGAGKTTALLSPIAASPTPYTLQDLRSVGKERGVCPYFLARQAIKYADVVVCSYQYLLDPKVAGIISKEKEMEMECVVVFDEAHNIDSACIEALSVSVRKQTLDGATRNLDRTATEIKKKIQGHRCQQVALPDDILKETVPGNIPKAEHFLSVL